MPRAVRRHVAGVDGCPGGWVVALVPIDGDGPTRLLVLAGFADVLSLSAAAVAVDMPIGLPDAGARACDVEVRRRLGPRRSSVFPAPIRGLLDAATYADALTMGRELDGRGLSKQAFHLLPKIREIDELITPRRQGTVVEAHPELCFASIAGAPCCHPKRTVLGRAERLAAIAWTFPDATSRLAEPHPGAKPDDVLDAYATAWTARRLAARAAEHIGDRARDATGLRMEIVL